VWYLEFPLLDLSNFQNLYILRSPLTRDAYD
jgi:hypothetical protein